MADLIYREDEAVADLTPLEKARARCDRKTCLICPDRAVIRKTSYCGVDGKLLHPMLLDPSYPSECLIEIEKRNRNRNYRKAVIKSE